MTKMHAKLKQYLKLFKKFVFLTKRVNLLGRETRASRGEMLLICTWKNILAKTTAERGRCYAFFDILGAYIF